MKNIKFGWLSTLGLLIAGLGAIFLVVSALGILFDFRLAVSDVPLPHDWESVTMLAIALALIAALSVYGAFMTTKFKAAKGQPGVRVALVVVGLGLLVLAFRGIQVVALTSTYGSMLAYYATDGDLEDVKSELEGDPTPEHLDEAVSRAAQYNNVAALKLLLAAGATPDNCPNSQTLIYEKVRFGQGDDAEIAKIVKALRGAGWPAEIKPDHAKQTPLEVATKAKKPLTAAALR